MTQPANIDLDGRFFADPGELYQRLRRESPVVRVTTPMGLKAWMATRYENVRPSLNDPRLSKSATRFVEVLERQSVSRGQRARFGDSSAGHILNTDPPDRTRLRKLVNRAFTGRGSRRCDPESSRARPSVLAGAGGRCGRRRRRRGRRRGSRGPERGQPVLPVRARRRRTGWRSRRFDDRFGRQQRRRLRLVELAR